jgi:hypothetical protein
LTLGGEFPPVVVADFESLDYYFNTKVFTYPSEYLQGSLHYMVIAGVRNKNGYKEF